MANGDAEARGLSLIVPAYNEHQGVEGAVEACLAALAGAGIPHEVVVVDDGSTDGTGDILDRRFSGRPGVLVRHRSRNGGFGAALADGIAACTLPNIMFAPVDNPLTRPVLDAFLSRLGTADVLVSYRVERIGYTPRMRLNSWLYERVISGVFGLRLRDYNWIHLYPRSLFGPGGIEIESRGIFTLAEILVRAKWRGCTFAEFPVEMRGRDYGVKTAATFKAAWRAGRECLLFFLRHAARRGAVPPGGVR